MEYIYSIDTEETNLITEDIQHYFYRIDNKVYFTENTFSYLKKNELNIHFNSLKKINLPKTFYNVGIKKIFFPLSNILQDRVPKETLIEIILFANSIASDLKIQYIKRHLNESLRKHPALKLNNFELNKPYSHDYLGSKRIYLLKITKKNFFDINIRLLWVLNSDYRLINYKKRGKNND